MVLAVHGSDTQLRLLSPGQEEIIREQPLVFLAIEFERLARTSCKFWDHVIAINQDAHM